MSTSDRVGLHGKQGVNGPKIRRSVHGAPHGYRWNPAVAGGVVVSFEGESASIAKPGCRSEPFEGFPGVSGWCEGACASPPLIVRREDHAAFRIAIACRRSPESR